MFCDVQALYESGRPEIGMSMMLRGKPEAESAEGSGISSEVVRLRMGLEFPLVPSSLLALVEAYLNVTSYLSSTLDTYTSLPIENLQDVYWPLPLIQGSGLPVAPVFRDILHRFEPPQTEAIASFVSYSGMMPPEAPIQQMAPALEPTSKRARSGATAPRPGSEPLSMAPSSGPSGVHYLSWAYNLLSLQWAEGKDEHSSAHHPQMQREGRGAGASESDGSASSDGYAHRLFAEDSVKGVEQRAAPAGPAPIIDIGEHCPV